MLHSPETTTENNNNNNAMYMYKMYKSDNFYHINKRFSKSNDDPKQGT